MRTNAGAKRRTAANEKPPKLVSNIRGFLKSRRVPPGPLAAGQNFSFIEAETAATRSLPYS